MGLVLTLAAAGPALAAGDGLVSANCAKCHDEFKKTPNTIAGEFQSLSNQAKSIQVDVGATNEIVKFTEATKVENVPSLKDLKKPIPVMVTFEQQGADRVATLVKAKPVIKVPEAQQLNVKQMEELLQKSPAEGKYALIDSRPPAHYQEGHLPGAINMPFGNMPNLMNKLPQDKSTLLVFYCGGFR
ncbi:MAG: rhodanese-like domain-containing protein [Pseudomonadota bacterium]